MPPDAPRRTRSVSPAKPSGPTPEQQALWSLFDGWTPAQMQGLVEGEHGSNPDGWPQPLDEVGLFKLLRELDEARLLALVGALTRKGLKRVLRLAALVPLSDAVVYRARERLVPPVTPAVALTRNSRIELYAQRARLRQPVKCYDDLVNVERLGVQLLGKKSPNGDQGDFRATGRTEAEGDEVPCPKCNALVPRPDSDAVRFICPVCHRRIMIVDEYSGERLADAYARGKRGKPHA